MTRPFDGDGQRPLVLGAGALLPPGFDFASLSHVTAQPGQILVVDLADVVETESANLPPRCVAAPAATTARPPAARAIVSSTAAAARAAESAPATAAEP